MSISELSPELTALVTAARDLSRELVQEVTDFAEFLSAKYAMPVAAEMETINDDEEVDLGGSPSSTELADQEWSDLSGILRDFGGHSAIGLV